VTSGEVNVSVASYFSNLSAIATEAFTLKPTALPGLRNIENRCLCPA